MKAAGVPVAERPPTKDDLVPNQVTSKSEVLRQGAEAMIRLSSNHSRDWDDWLKVLAALGIGRHAAMLEGDANEPRGYKYCKAFAKWLRCHEVFQAIDQADRKRMFDCLDNLSAIEEWRAGLSPAQLSKWNYPPTVLREWKRSCRPPSEPQAAKQPSESSKSKLALLLTPQELHQQLEHIPLDTFYRHIMPDEVVPRTRRRGIGPCVGGAAHSGAGAEAPCIQGYARSFQDLEKFRDRLS